MATIFPAWAETIILHLKNGDRIAGTIVAEDTNRVVITTTWIKELAVPLAAIERREKPAPETGVVQAPVPARTNDVVAASPNTPVPPVSVPPLPAPKAKPKLWKVEAQLGADFLVGAKDQEIYYGRAKLTYERPYATRPKEYLRNILDYTADYGRTEGVQSANRMDGIDKTDVDIGKKLFVYNLAGVGYDEVRKIDLRYEVGPGLGYHLFNRSNLVVNAEGGLDYQAQYRSDNTTTKNFFPRVAEDLTWRFSPLVTLTEKLEFFPPVQSEYRARLETTLSYALWRNISLNLTLLDLYDSQPAQDVPRNELQVRSSIGVKF